MKFKVSLALLALMAAVLFAVPASAEGPSRTGKIATPAPIFASEPVREWSWSGVYLDLGAGGQASIIDLNAQMGELSGGLNGLGAWDFVGNARVGFNFQPQGSPLVFGLFAGYSLGSVASEGNLSAGQDAVGFSAEITPTWDAGALVGLVGPNKSLLYAGYKYQMAEFDLSIKGDNGTLCAEVLRCSHDLSGHGLIAGFKMPITPGFVAGIEYGYTRFDTESLLREAPEGVRLNLEPEVHTVMLRGSVLIGPNLFGN